MQEALKVFHEDSRPYPVAGVRERIIAFAQRVHTLFRENVTVVRLVHATFYGPHHGAPAFDFEQFHLAFGTRFATWWWRVSPRASSGATTDSARCWRSWALPTCAWKSSWPTPRRRSARGCGRARTLSSTGSCRAATAARGRVKIMKRLVIVVVRLSAGPRWPGGLRRQERGQGVSRDRGRGGRCRRAGRAARDHRRGRHPEPQVRGRGQVRGLAKVAEVLVTEWVTVTKGSCWPASTAARPPPGSPRRRRPWPRPRSTRSVPCASSSGS